MTALLTFLVLAGLIFFSGKRLSYYGGLVARHLGLGQAWIGLILMASVTSLPELSVGISSVARVGSADLALGDVLGSCVFNLFLLSVLDVLVAGEPLSARVSTSHILAGAMSLILVALVGLELHLPATLAITSWIAVSSGLFLVLYLVTVRLLFRYEARMNLSPAAAGNRLDPAPALSLKQALSYYLLHAGVVVSAALFLPDMAQTIAVEFGLGESLVATLFLAASTSLPEAAVSVSAVRMGSYDLAVGNLMGSNLFNILILGIDDLFYTPGHLLKAASDTHLISVFGVTVMTGIAMAGLMYRSPRKLFFLAWDAWLIGLVYLGNLWLLYYFRHGG